MIAMGPAWTVADLEYWDERIRAATADLGLDCYPQEFEVCDHDQMLSLMAYSGMPSHYPHWSFGKAYEQQKTLYDHGVAGLPYEMVINADPAIAYLMRDNSLALQILTMAHVYGHNDFFKNNFTFRFFRADLVVEQFKAHAERVRDYVEDPSVGKASVERVLDAAHALAFQCRRNPAIRKPDTEEQKARAVDAARPPADPHRAIHKPPEWEEPDLHKLPLEPEEDVLLFIRDHNPRLAEWERDLITIVHERTRYFLPQMETKIMNEGWACWVHRHIMNQLDLPPDLHMEFLVRHNQVVRPVPGRINPYNLGLMLWDDIMRRHDDPTEEDREHLPPDAPTGIEAIFHIREVDRDASFLRRFLTPGVMRELDLFEYEPNNEGDLTVTRIANTHGWRRIKNTLIANTGVNALPVIRVVDGDYADGRELLMTHDHDGRELDLEYAEKTLAFAQDLWGRTVRLETQIDEEPVTLVHDGEKFDIER